MLHQDITNVSFESFQEEIANKKVALLYPWSNYRNLFLSYFLNDVQDGLLYHRIPTTHNSLKIWVRGLLDALSYVVDGFGSNTRDVIESGGKADAIGKALAEDLRIVEKDRAILYLDELDRVPHDGEFKTFLRALVDDLPGHVQLAINSRLLTYSPWTEMVRSGEAVVLGTVFQRSNLMFSAEETPKPQLEVYAFGRGHALVDGQPVENWDGALPRNLFFYFIDNPLVTRDQIFDVFWPQLNVKEATNVFHVTKRKITERISAQIEDGENYEITQYSAGFYMPGAKIVRHYDVFDFVEAMEQALISEDEYEKETLFRQSIELYKAHFLQTVRLPWVEERREQLRMMYAEALIGMARILNRRDALEASLGFYVRTLKELPQREDIHREVMKLYMSLGRKQDAVNQYRQLEGYLQESVDVPPSKESRELFQKLLQE